MKKNVSASDPTLASALFCLVARVYRRAPPGASPEKSSEEGQTPPSRNQTQTSVRRSEERHQDSPDECSSEVVVVGTTDPWTCLPPCVLHACFRCGLVCPPWYDRSQNGCVVFDTTPKDHLPTVPASWGSLVSGATSTGGKAPGSLVCGSRVRTSEQTQPSPPRPHSSCIRRNQRQHHWRLIAVNSEDTYFSPWLPTGRRAVSEVLRVCASAGPA